MEYDNDVITTECDNCLMDINIDLTTSCEKCGKTLCPHCVCEDCYNEE